MTLDVSSGGFATIGIADFLEADKRPTIVLDCQDFDTLNNEQFRPVFTNTAFRTLSEKSPRVFTDINGSEEAAPYLAFRLWTASHTHENVNQSDVHAFAGIKWQQFDVGGRWRVISSLGTKAENKEDLVVVNKRPHMGREHVSFKKVRSPSPAKAPTKYFDYTAPSPNFEFSDHVEFLRTRDWGSTPVGPMQHWPYQLRTMINMILTDPLPAIIFWGDDMISIYNEAYLSVAGSRHPTLMGQSAPLGWAGVWEPFNDIFVRGRATGQATQLDDVLLFLKPMGGYTEENYLTLTVMPLLGELGEVTCFYQRLLDVTRLVLSQRRMTILLEVSHLTSAAKTLKHYWQNLLASIENFTIDIPFAVLYSMDLDTESSDHGLSGSTSTFWREGVVGLPSDCLEKSFDAKTDVSSLAKVFRRAQEAGGHVTIDDTDECWPTSLMQYQDKERGWGETCKHATVYTLRPSNGTETRGFLILGVNRRQPYNENHQLFRHTLGRQISSSLASIVLFEDEVRANMRRIEQAATDRAMLSQELIQRARDTEVLENRFFRIAHLSPVGIFVLEKDGSVIYANDKWYALVSIPKCDRTTLSWTDSIWPEDIDLVATEWDKLVTKGDVISFEFRLKKPHKSIQNPSDTSSDASDASPFTWVLGSSYPDFSEDGTFLSITGTLTDIHQQKSAEVESEKKASEALESKRQQENFMDMVSHEIRNPLNAILQCADSIIRTLPDKENKRNRQELVAESVESAETIVHCAEHQKRIVDDILTLSKLDSNLLTVTPIPIQPVQLVRHALKMFHTQSQNARVDLELELDPSLTQLDIDWVQVDPSRVLQIIINLLTNAIKFTASEGRGKVTVGVAASTSEPLDREGGIHYLRSQEPQSGQRRDFGSAEQLYLSFTIQDTGRGLSDDEKTRLFSRFSQASPRTHVQYGGSGLGLYISRQLTELQGGKIGLASQENKGSVFAFYIQTERFIPEKAPTTAAEEGLMRIHLTPSTESTLLFQGWLSGASILIVEDNLVNQRVLRKQLSPLVRETSVANNGVEALEHIRETRYWHANAGLPNGGKQLHAVLMDIEMPVMGGVACIKEIRRLQQVGHITDHVLVIAITANARMEQMKMMTEAGMDDVLTKPFKIKDLTNVLERAFRTYQIGSMKNG